MSDDQLHGRLISFDEAGFTGPRLLDERQPYFVYASHDLTNEESASLIGGLRERYSLKGKELKAKKLKKRSDWPKIMEDLCVATRGRAKVIVHDKKVALAGKFFEYFFEPILAANSGLFYAVDFHKYVMTAICILMRDSSADYVDLAEQMQSFMRTFDPSDAPDIFLKESRHAVELDRILKFCRGYAEKISEETMHLRVKEGGSGTWTLDLTSTALFSLLFFGWGHVHPRLHLLCDDSEPLAAASTIFNAWVRNDQSNSIDDGKALHSMKGNLVAPVKFGSSATHPPIQVADLLAGMTLDASIKEAASDSTIGAWLRAHQLHSHSISFLPEFAQPSERRVRVGREILKELSRRAGAGSDPLAGMDDFVRRIRLRLG